MPVGETKVASTFYGALLVRSGRNLIDTGLGNAKMALPASLLAFTSGQPVFPPYRSLSVFVQTIAISVAVVIALAASANAQVAQPAAAPAKALTPAAQLPSGSAAASGPVHPIRELLHIVSSGSWRELVGWFAEHGIAVLAIVAIIAAILWVSNLLEGRIIALLTRGERGATRESEARARTLVGVLHNALRTIAVVVGVIMVLDELAVPIGPLLGGVAVVGLAVAFGAQSLIKDWFTGFMVLLEQQYVIGDVVQLGNSTGEVERITLRLTVLRDQEGRVHFIPHGQITTVINHTHGSAQAVVEVRVAYREDVDRVIGVLMEVAHGLCQDPAFGPFIQDEPQMLGVEALSNTAFAIKLKLKTVATKRETVKRELLRRIKNRFTELGIELAA
jgi:small-conductance mechanosensitive channel